ncbi:MAG: SRPBCC family protein [Ruegeria sp.]
MQFSAREDIQAPIEAVFDMMADFERFERMAMRRGVDVRRTVEVPKPQVGACWTAVFSVRGKPRHVSIELSDYERPGVMRFVSVSKGMSGLTTIELLPLSPRHTRLSIEMSLAARTLPARLLLQSLKLGKSRFRRLFQLRLNEFAREMEERYFHGN